MQWLLDKCIVIIGGTAGMGLAAAEACIAEGARVCVLGKDPDHCENATRVLDDNGAVVASDAVNENAAEIAIDTCVKKFGRMDGLYHVAGGSGRKFGDGPLHELTAEGWEKTIQINLTSLMFSNRAAVKYFLQKQQAGVILNMSSVLGYSPSPKHFSTHAYAAAKSAVFGFTKSIASYYAPYNIRANVLAPALIETPMSLRAISDEQISAFVANKQPLDGGRAGVPGDVNGATIFMLSDQSKFVTGQVIAVDGGWSVTEGQYLLSK